MSRSGYSDDGDYIALWRSAVDAAMGGKRGQAFLREMLTSLDALPAKRLLRGVLVCHEGCCALGAVALRRSVEVSGLDAWDHDALSDTFGIARAMVAEIMYMNDERELSPEQRFAAVREWVVASIDVTPEELG